MSVVRKVLLDEHVGRVLEHVLAERGFRVEQAKDRFGERTTDAELLAWCEEHGYLLLTNDAKDFEALHADQSHAGLLVYFDQALPDDDPEGLARAVEIAIVQYGIEGIADELVDLQEWYEWVEG